jgi:hypothetical protein
MASSGIRGVGAESSDDRLRPALGAMNHPDSELGEMKNYPGVIAVLIDALKKKGMRFDEKSFFNGDITHHNNYIVTIRGAAAEVLHRAFHGIPSGVPAHHGSDGVGLLLNDADGQRRPDGNVAVEISEVAHKCGDACPPSNAKNQGLSNAKKVDAADALADPLNSCQNNQNPNTQSKSGGGQMSALLCLLWLSIGNGFYPLQSAPASQLSLLNGCAGCQEAAK